MRKSNSENQKRKLVLEIIKQLDYTGLFEDGISIQDIINETFEEEITPREIKICLHQLRKQEPYLIYRNKKYFPTQKYKRPPKNPIIVRSVSILSTNFDKKTYDAIQLELC